MFCRAHDASNLDEGTARRCFPDFIGGKFKHELLRFGVKDGVVDLAPFGASVPKEVQDEVTKVKQAIIAGTLQPFKGPIKDQNGKVRIEGDQPDTITLEKMDYLVEGVVGVIPN